MADLIPSVDAGHGGIYPKWYSKKRAGLPCTGGQHNGIVEADFCLDLALRTGEMVRNHNMTPFLTRTTDRFLSLGQRAKLAAQVGAFFAVSYHVNGHATHTEWRGMTLYCMPDDEIAMHAAKIVAQYCPHDLKRGKMIFPITDLPGSEDDWLERPLAVVEPYDKRGIPGLLIEVAFSSNKLDAQLLRTETILHGLAACTTDGILAAADKLEELSQGGK